MLIKKFLYSALFCCCCCYWFALRCVALVLNFLTIFVCFIQFIIWNFLDDFVVVVCFNIFGGENCTGFGIWNVERMFCVCCVIVRYVVFKNYM